MPRTGARGGPETRARIAEVANRLFIEGGFETVTVAEVAREAGVSSVTVFNHFPTKEDLFFDRTDEAVELIASAVHDRPARTSAVAALRTMTFRLVDEQLPLSGLDPRSAPFFRTVAESRVLVARARAIGALLQRTLQEELERDDSFTGDAGIFAAFYLGGYSTVMVTTARRLLAGDDTAAVRDEHRRRLETLFAALEAAFPG